VVDQRGMVVMWWGCFFRYGMVVVISDDGSVLGRTMWWRKAEDGGGVGR